MIPTEYANTDFDLKSTTSFDTLNKELSALCSVLHYTQGEDGHYHACFESNHHGESEDTGAERDIRLIVDAIHKLSDTAKKELARCYLREFNVGFECGDSWAYVHKLPPTCVSAIADAACSLAVTLYPMRRADGTPR